MTDHPDKPVGGENWGAYFDAVATLPPRETLIAALDRFKAPGSAVDLGCGEGRDTVEMLRRGWRVLAVDAEAGAIQRLRARVERELGVGASKSEDRLGWHEQLETLIGRYQDVPIPMCDLVNASFSIPHCEPRDFPGLWANVASAVRPGGRFAGQFFGVHDGWRDRFDGIPRTFHTRDEVEAMLASFDVEMLDEVERMGKTAMGEPKYWHVFHVVARKKP